MNFGPPLLAAAEMRLRRPALILRLGRGASAWAEAFWVGRQQAPDLGDVGFQPRPLSFEALEGGGEHSGSEILFGHGGRGPSVGFDLWLRGPFTPNWCWRRESDAATLRDHGTANCGVAGADGTA